MSGIVREPDYLKFLQEAERKAVDPDLYLDVNDENESGWDAEEKGLLEEAMQSWSRLKRTWRTMMEGEREIEVEPAREAGRVAQCEVGDRVVGEGQGVSRQFEGVTTRRVWEDEKWIEEVSGETHVSVSRCLCKERGAPRGALSIQEPVQEDTRSRVRARELKHATQREDKGRSKGDWGKQVWMVLDGRSRSWDIWAEEQVEELREREMEQRKWDGG